MSTSPKVKPRYGHQSYPVVQPQKMFVESTKKFQVCEYQRSLHLPRLPDMVFADNSLLISHSTLSNVYLEFNALDALKMVNSSHLDESIKVAASPAWLQARQGTEFVQNTVNPFDWTYSTKYMGSAVGFQVSFSGLPHSN